MHLLGLAGWRSLNDAANSAEGGHVFLPVSVKRIHRDLSSFWKPLDQDLFYLVDYVCLRINWLFLKDLDWFKLVDVQPGVASAVELVVYFEDPSADVQILGDELS